VSDPIFSSVRSPLMWVPTEPLTPPQAPAAPLPPAPEPTVSEDE
jgi:hypothetical protein